MCRSSHIVTHQLTQVIGGLSVFVAGVASVLFVLSHLFSPAKTMECMHCGHALHGVPMDRATTCPGCGEQT